MNKFLVYIYEYMTIVNEITGNKYSFYRKNVWNSFLNNILNNGVSNWIKELFYYTIGFPYSEYLYWKDAPDNQPYLMSFTKKWDWKLLNFVSTITLTNSQEYALDLKNVWFWKRFWLQRDLNKACRLTNKNGFVFKKVLTYFEGLTDSK